MTWKKGLLFLQRGSGIFVWVCQKMLLAIFIFLNLIRSGSSAGANYIEANENIGDKDFKMKIKTSRRESKETAYWLRLVITDGSVNQEKREKHTKARSKRVVTDFLFHFKEKRIKFQLCHKN